MRVRRSRSRRKDMYGARFPAPRRHFDQAVRRPGLRRGRMAARAVATARRPARGAGVTRAAALRRAAGEGPRRCRPPAVRPAVDRVSGTAAGHGSRESFGDRRSVPGGTRRPWWRCSRAGPDARGWARASAAPPRVADGTIPRNCTEESTREFIPESVGRTGRKRAVAEKPPRACERLSRRSFRDSPTVFSVGVLEGEVTGQLGCKCRLRPSCRESSE